jgi:hypothetical protein
MRCMWPRDHGGNSAVRIKQDVQATSPMGSPQLPEPQSITTGPRRVSNTFPGWKSP